ncbi:MAG: hypothetical protein VKO21_03785 [Candidatus Sericytochromatia bacterium]|nr:hypothetical protein [Candidatus Sericytochromatia bacterium]
MNPAWQEALGPERARQVQLLLERIAAEADPFRPLIAGRLKAIQAWQLQLAPLALSEAPAASLSLAVGLAEACLILADPSVHRAARAVKGARALATALDAGRREEALASAAAIERDAAGLLDELRGRLSQLERHLDEGQALARAHRFAACHALSGQVLGDLAILTHVRHGKIPEVSPPALSSGLATCWQAMRDALFTREDPALALDHARTALVLSGALAHGTTGLAVRWIAQLRQIREAMANGTTAPEMGLAALFVGHDDLMAALAMLATDPARLSAPLQEELRSRDWSAAARRARKLAVVSGVLALPLVERAASLGTVKEALETAAAERDRETALALLEGV